MQTLTQSDFKLDEIQQRCLNIYLSACYFLCLLYLKGGYELTAKLSILLSFEQHRQQGYLRSDGFVLNPNLICKKVIQEHQGTHKIDPDHFVEGVKEEILCYEKEERTHFVVAKVEADRLPKNRYLLTIYNPRPDLDMRTWTLKSKRIFKD